MNPKLLPRIVQLPSPNRSRGQGRKIDMIVIHSTVGAFAPSLDWLRKRDRPNRTSAHYIIDKGGAVVQLVDETDAAWHGGFGRWNGKGGINGRSIGVELENTNDGKDPYPTPQLQACLWICVRACHRHGIWLNDVIGHADVDPKRKTDPKGFPWKRFKMSLHNAIAKP